MDSWGGVSASSSPLNANWEGHFKDQLPKGAWWSTIQSPFTYGQGSTARQSYDYDPGSSGLGSYSPISSLTHQIIDADVQNFLSREFPELFDFTQGVQYGGVGGAGKVGMDPGFGQFSKTPEVYAEIQAAADRYGVPANFLQAIIAKESSGDWFSNSRPVAVASRGGKRIHGYVGVFEDAARSWGFNFDALTGNRAGQIEMLASGLRGMYDRLHAQNPQYGWRNVAAMHYSGNPDMSYTPGDSFQHGTTVQYVAQMEAWWKALDEKAGNTWSNYTDTGQNRGIGSPQSQAWGRYAQHDQSLLGLAAQTGVPANAVKAFMRYGDERGLGFSNDPQGIFTTMVNQVQERYRETGNWRTAFQRTLRDSGLPPDDQIRIQNYWDELNADMSGVFTGTPGASAPTNQMEAIWGGLGYGVSQENGETNSWTAANPNMYDYGSGLGISGGGHPGMDITFPGGTKLYSPGSGTVIIVGPNNGYRWYSSWGANTGQLRIKLDNGHELILGHMSNITVKPGDRVAPGMFVGLSGGGGSGDHLHLEYRIPSPGETGTGWRSVDPRAALAGQFTGYNQGARTGLGFTQALTFQNLMRAGASGQPIPSGPVYSQGGGRSAWNTWLRDAMLGNDPRTFNRINYADMYQTIGGGSTGGGIGVNYSYDSRDN